MGQMYPSPNHHYQSNEWNSKHWPQPVAWPHPFFINHGTPNRHWPQSVAWLHPFFLHHQTPDRHWSQPVAWLHPFFLHNGLLIGTDPNQWPGLILSSSITGLLMDTDPNQWPGLIYSSSTTGVLTDTDPNWWPGLILSLSTTGILRDPALLPLFRLSSRCQYQELQYKDNSLFNTVIRATAVSEI